MNAISVWEVDVLVDEPELDADALVGAPAALRLRDDVEPSQRLVALVVTAVVYQGRERDRHRFSLSLASPEHVLTERSGYRVFLDKSTKDIVTEVLTGAGIGADRVAWRLSGEYLPRPQCTQYGETEWGFIERLLAEEGIAYWFESQDETPQLILADDPASHEGLAQSAVLPFDDGTAPIPYRRFRALSRTEAMVSDAVLVREFDVRAPDVHIDGKAGDGELEHFEYPACVLTAAAADRRAAVRLEQLRRRRVVLEGESDCIRVQPGRLVTLEGASDAWHTGDHLLIAVVHEYDRALRGGLHLERGEQPLDSRYRNLAEMVPHPGCYRPAVPLGPPKVDGFEPAITTGASGEEIHVDDLGRVKIRFPWDRSGVRDEKSSCWVRTVQPNMTGSMILPRVGWEVPVAYIDGNPDKPVVLGRLYNGNSVVPYGLPGASATSSLQSATSPGGGSTTEIRMVDSAGKQELFIHAAKDQTVVVGGSASTDVSVNATSDVSLTLRTTISGSQTVSIGGSQSVDVGTDYGLSVDGGRTEMVGGLEHIKVTANRRVSSASYTELIGAFYGVQCNQSNTSVKGAFTQLVGGSLNTAGGLGVSETVLASRMEMVGGAKSLTVARGVSESVIGARIITAGSCREKAAGKVTTGTKAAGKITVGSSANMVASDGFAIEAPTITIEAASLSAKALALEGGALHAKDGKTLVKASTIKRQGGGALG